MDLPAPPGAWRDRVAVVTGASSGIGRAVARALLEGGLRVALTGRRAEPLEVLARRFGEGRALVHPADLRDPDAVRGLFAAVDAAWGRLDVLVNAAGVGYCAPLAEDHLDRWREMLELNVLALAQCTAEAIPRMRRSGDDGVVVHVSSLSAHRVPRGSGMYAATKHAVRALAEALRLELRELGSGIRVCQVSPGLVETAFAARYHGSAERGREVYARHRVLDPEDVARAVVFLLAQPPHVQVHDLLLRSVEQPT